MADQRRYPSRRTLAPQPAPPGLYRSTYDPERGAAICRRLAAGESLRAICRADPAMPTEKTVWNWARAHEEFRLMKAHALSQARARSLAARDDAELMREIEFGGPRGRTGRPSGYGEAVAQRVLEGVVAGGTLAEVCARPGMPSVGAVYYWLRRYPEFLALYRAMKRVLADALVERACETLPWIGEKKSWPMLERTIRDAERRARRLSLKRYAEAAGPVELRVTVEEPDGRVTTIYEGRR